MIHAENERSTACTLRGDAYALTFGHHGGLLQNAGTTLSRRRQLSPRMVITLQ